MNTNSTTLVYVFEALEPLAERVLALNNYTQGTFTLERFQNQELHLTLGEDVTGSECLIIGSITPPETNLFTLLILSHTLKKQGARKVTAVIPYLAYCRHDKEEKHKSQLTSLIGSLFASSGIDDVIAFDIHSTLVHTLYPIPVLSLSPASLFADEIKRIGFLDATIVSPDKGALSRSHDVAQALTTTNFAWIRKTRTEEGVTHKEVEGSVSEKVVIIDDILDTGSTLISCAEKVLEQGANEIVVMVTHGLFTGEKWKHLWDLDVKAIYCTNTVPHVHTDFQNHNIKVLSIDHELVRYLISRSPLQQRAQ